MSIGFPVKFIYKDKEYYTLYFDEEDILLSNNDNIICYSNQEELILEQSKYSEIDDSLYIYNFDSINLFNPIDYNDILNKWNILNTIAKMFNMYFEGDSKKRTYTYNYLFCCVTSKEELSKMIRIPDKCIKDINKVFYKKDKYLKKLLR